MKKLIENRPWGKFTRFTHNEPSTVKIITVKPWGKLSYQKHTQRDEFWRVIDGDGIFTLNDEKYIVDIGHEIFVKKGQKHRMQAGEQGMKVLEIAFGHFDENDIERIEDEYERVQKSNKNTQKPTRNSILI